jgi:hypothetical protein
LLYALQFSALALGFGATPEQRLEYFPKSSISDKVLAKVRKDQWSEMWLRAAYGKRAALWPRWLLPTRDQVPPSGPITSPMRVKRCSSEHPQRSTTSSNGSTG